MCTLNLVGDDNEKFEKFWQDTVAQQTKEVAQKALVYIDVENKCKEMESNSVRTKTLQEILKHSINFEPKKGGSVNKSLNYMKNKLVKSVISEID